NIRTQRKLRRHDTVEHYAAGNLRIASREVLRNPRAVRDAVQVERRVTEFPAQRLQVRDGDAGREKAWIVSKVVEAAPGVRDHFFPGVLRLQHLLHFAVEGRGCSRAALVEKHDVAIAADLFEGTGVGRVELDGRLAGAAGDRHEGILHGLECEGGNDGYPEFHHARPGRGWIERTFEDAAARFPAGKA